MYFNNQKFGALIREVLESTTRCKKSTFYSNYYYAVSGPFNDADYLRYPYKPKFMVKGTLLV